MLSVDDLTLVLVHLLLHFRVCNLYEVCTMCLKEDIGNEAGPIPLRKR